MVGILIVFIVVVLPPSRNCILTPISRAQLPVCGHSARRPIDIADISDKCITTTTTTTKCKVEKQWIVIVCCAAWLTENQHWIAASTTTNRRSRNKCPNGRPSNQPANQQHILLIQLQYNIYMYIHNIYTYVCIYMRVCVVWLLFSPSFDFFIVIVNRFCFTDYLLHTYTHTRTCVH